MKKIILLVASILTAIQTIANRSVERTNSNPLVLSSSDGIFDNYKSSFYVIINDNRQVNLVMKDDGMLLNPQ